MAKTNHDCNRDGCYLDRVSKWFEEVIDPCMPGKMRGGDFDYVLERKGHLLVLEAKSSNEHTLEPGQRITFEESTKRSRDGLMVIVVYREEGRRGGPVNGEVYMVQRIWKGVSRKLEACSTDDIQDKVKKWYKWANSQPKC